MKIDTSNVTEEEMISLYDKDGDMREQGFTEESEGEPEEEAEEEEAQEETEEETEEQADPTPDQIDWSKVDPAIKAAYEKAAKEAESWQKNHSKLQSNFTKQSQTYKQLESNLSKYEQKVKILEQFEERLANNPRLQQILAKELNSDPFTADVPDYLAKDPAYQLMQERFVPYIKSLEQKLQALEPRVSKIDEYEKRTQEEGYKKQLDTQLDSAKGVIKSMFGRDATEDEVTKVLEYMVENKFYGNGKAAALAVFQDQYEKAVQERYQSSMREKSKKFGVRNKTISSANAKSNKELSLDEAIAEALAENGVEF